MTYVSSDWHGCSVSDIEALLEKAGFSDEDFLFVLGDVIDRGEHGAELLSWLSQQPNMSLILGNHEAMLLACEFLFDEVSEQSLSRLDNASLCLISNWMQNGGWPTLNGLRSMLRRDPELVAGLLDYLHDAPLYECIEVEGRDFLLVHGGIEGFIPGRPLHSYAPDDFLWARPTPDTRYSDSFFTILGHTPTVYIDPASRGRIYKAPTWACIDTGSPALPPALLRLEDMAEFYG